MTAGRTTIIRVLLLQLWQQKMLLTILISKVLTHLILACRTKLAKSLALSSATVLWPREEGTRDLKAYSCDAGVPDQDQTTWTLGNLRFFNSNPLCSICAVLCCASDAYLAQIRYAHDKLLDEGQISIFGEIRSNNFKHSTRTAYRWSQLGCWKLDLLECSWWEWFNREKDVSATRKYDSKSSEHQENNHDANHTDKSIMSINLIW